MAEMLSPGVYTTEIDASTIVPTVSNSVGVFAGNFVKGPAGVFSLVTNTDELVDLYGEPTNTNYNDFYQAYNFLQYGNKLLLSRAIDDTSALNAGAYAADTEGAVITDYDTAENLVRNNDDLESGTFTFAAANDKALFMAQNPGTWGNDISVAIATSTDFNSGNDAFEGIGLDDLFEYSPDTNEYGIIVKVGDNIVETFTVSLDETAKDYQNNNMYIENVINRQSNYIYVVIDGANENGLASAIDASAITLVGGADSTPVAGDLTDAYEIFENKEELDIDIIIGNELDFGASAIVLAEKREDCIAFIGASDAITGGIVGEKASAATTNLVDSRATEYNTNSMFAVLAGNYKYQYDRYSDKYRWVNIAGDIAGLRAATNTNRASWWASAGLERGQIKNVTKLAFNPTQAQRDVLYKAGINPIVSFPGQGTVMWGQKTLLSKPSSFDRVNVRGLFNTLERALSKMAKYQVMEFNDTFTRNRITSMIKPFLSGVQAGRGIQDFLVVCDTSNNTPDVISRNQLIVDVYVKPTYVAEFIHLKFTNAGTNSFAEVIGG
jgi:hypothetical protein